ncbi:MAG TPA: acetyl-CoA carboxylase [Chloroflexota bacterium]|nr:acetyl-CoA carboxylase [Chloroflexota bacterium]
MDEPPEDEPDYAGLVRGLLEDLAGTTITNLELRHGALRVALRRVPGAGGLVSPATEATAVEKKRPLHWHVVEAPLTGIFYIRPAPDEEPYVLLGSHVEPGDVVGLVETMKMYNEVTADVTGTVREIVVENGSLVEAGQPLLYVEPGHAEDALPTAVV